MRILQILVCLCCLFCFSKLEAEENFIWVSEEDGPIQVSFDTKGYVFYKGTDVILGDPAEAFLKLVAVKEDKKFILQRTTSLKGYVSLRKPEEALAFVRLFTNLDTHYLFKDADWIEVVNSKADVIDKRLLFGSIVKSEWEKLGLFEPKVKLIEDGFLVERCLLNSKREIFHSEEKVGRDGEYSMKVKRLIQKDSQALFPMYE